MNYRITIFTICLFILTITNAGAENYAILVGISDYADAKIPDLRFPEKDVDYLADILTEQVGFKPDNIKRLKGTEATYINVKSAIIDWLAEKRIRPTDLLIFYFSGHGTVRETSGGHEPDGTDEFLLPQNAQSGKFSTYLKDDELIDWFKENPAKRIAILDACFQGGGKSFQEEGKNLAIQTLTFADDDFALVTDALLTASDGNEPAHEDEGRGYGILTAGLGDALTQTRVDADADGKVDIKEVHAHLTNTIKRQTPQLIPENADVLLVDRTVGTVELITTPAGARVTIDNQYHGETPITLPLNVGTYSLKIEADGYEIHSESLSVRPIQNPPLRITLKRLHGWISGVVIDPDGPPIPDAHIALLGPGNYKTMTDAAGSFEIEVEVGRYDGVVVEHSRYETKTHPAQTDVVDDETTKLGSITLLPKAGRLTVSSVPPAATVHVGGRVYGTTPLPIPALPIGEYTLEVSLADYFVWSDRVSISVDTPTKRTVLLRPKPGGLTVSSTPPGATVAIDGVEVGKSGETLSDIPAGKHAVTVSRPGYVSKTIEVEIPPNRSVTHSVTLEELPPEVGSVVITSQPVSGAKVYWNEGYVGNTPHTMKTVPVGGYRVRIELADYKTWSDTVRVNKDRTTEVRTRLIGLPATLTVGSDPSGADVLVDGEKVGVTPYDGEIPSGSHTVGVKKSGYEDSAERVIQAPPKGGIPLNFTLEKLTELPPPPDMVLIPAGEFWMGSPDGEGFNNEHPRHKVYLDAFYIDKYEVTNAEFKVFIDANPEWRVDRIPSQYHDGDYLKHWNGNNYPSGKGDHPVVYVSWYAAAAYAGWVGKRLPTESEWEKAARGGLEGKKYPWGDSIDSRVANYGGNIGTTGVGKYPPNGYGLYDVAGNVWEWCMDKYDSGFYAKSPQTNPIAGGEISFVNNNFTNVKTARLLRGGSWDNYPDGLRVACRNLDAPAGTGYNVGFRCAGLVTP